MCFRRDTNALRRYRPKNDVKTSKLRQSCVINIKRSLINTLIDVNARIILLESV